MATTHASALILRHAHHRNALGLTDSPEAPPHQRWASSNQLDQLTHCFTTERTLQRWLKGTLVLSF